MELTRPMVAGAVVALAGHGVALGVTLAVAIAAGGGPDADLDSGGRFGVLFSTAFTYGIAQLVLLWGCVALSGPLGRGSSSGLVAGWVLELAASLSYVCSGFGA
ncbi:hypothetical protein [Micromonospora avicenniae]|uniref:hypothetical protein n=1 Tax=Micromonospora avicenniae TaxID=1198245 RepID=UPI00331EA1A2